MAGFPLSQGGDNGEHGCKCRLDARDNIVRWQDCHGENRRRHRGDKMARVAVGTAVTAEGTKTPMHRRTKPAFSVLVVAVAGAAGLPWVQAEPEPAPCKAFRLALHRSASATLLHYSEGTPTGAMRSGDANDILAEAHEALSAGLETLREVEATELGFEQCLSDDPSQRAAADISRGIFRLLLKGGWVARQRLSELTEPFGEGAPSLFGEGVLWKRMVLSGWPVFRLAAVLEHETREHVGISLYHNRLRAPPDPAENCTEDQEDFRELSNLFAGEGRTVKFQNLRQFFREFIAGQSTEGIGPQFVLDLAFGKPREPWRCLGSLATAFATLADALQCHWHQPRSVQTHELLDIVLDQAQRWATHAFASRVPSSGEASPRLLPEVVMMRSPWPMLQFLARLQPPETGVQKNMADTTAIVSWSSREAELGGFNWVEGFAREVFGDSPDVKLQVDFECADIYIFRSKCPVNFGGVLVFVDGETGPEEGNLRELLAGYPASIVIGPRPAGGLSRHFGVPYASTSFSSRSLHTPADLLQPRDDEVTATPRRFAAYLTFKCHPHREHFFRLLDAASRAAGLGGVDVLSRCGGTTTSEDERRKARYSATYFDDAVMMYMGYRFAIVFENKLSPRYVTEKIVNAFLAGSVPIYWGTPFVHRLFNPRAFIHVNGFLSFEQAVQHVVEVALDPVAYEAYTSAPKLANVTDASWYFSWHKDLPPLHQEVRPFREELAEAALKMHQAGLRGVMPAIERRYFDYMHLFENH
eukprot:TRINITY_DN62485_c0_g1_i1.p1 TRINITY_DN62485_c0_g1~~TRINITY_DN62485_c0_g1_i1.p1  ORF type:complete len:804 (-),score=134.92 TRINITY_DN62485_c0_g1_i1:174-2444(-)